MKLTVIGGGGVRAPLFVASALRWQERIGLGELCLMDIDAGKLALMGALSRLVAVQADSPVQISATTDARAALEDADYVVTTVRVGGDQGRVLDERIALKHDVLGQETTGPGGFAMALRSIPAILGYAALMEEICPQAWMFNFTNPAGLVTQALHDAGFQRTVGICDGANQAQHAAARWFGVPPARVTCEVYGLNHLSWTRRAWLDGRDVLPELLADPRFLAAEQGEFAPELVALMGVWLNEYLYYYYYAEKAVASIRGDEMTRGEEIQHLNQVLLEQLAALDIERQPEQALRAFLSYNRRRQSTYMHYARAGAPSMEDADRVQYDVGLDDEAGEGYAGVTLSIMEAFETGTRSTIGLNVANGDAVACMGPDDVVEVSCLVDGSGIRPIAIGAIPEAHELLMRSVKAYERLTVEAIRTRSRATAVMALMAHPLVLSYSRAVALVDEYLGAHAQHVGDWQ